MPTTPLTTPAGLQIGRLYQPAQRVVMSDDALQLQRALIAKPLPAFARTTWADRAVCVALALGAAVALAVAAGVLP